MTAPSDQNSARALALARQGLMRPGAPAALPERLLVVDARAMPLEDAQEG